MDAPDQCFLRFWGHPKMKHGNIFYIELTRYVFADEYKPLSVNAKWLYTVLNELEHRFCGNNVDWFYRSNELLVNDTGMSLSSVKRAKAELLNTDLIQAWQMHWVDTETKKKSEKHVTAYRILK